MNENNQREENERCFQFIIWRKVVILLKAMSSEKEKGPYLTCLYRQSVAQHNESCAVF